MKDIDECKKTHNTILDFIKSKNIISVEDYLDLPNKYGDNTSKFYARHNVKDRWKEQDVSIDYRRSIVFLASIGYFPFETVEDIKNIINKNTKLR